MRVCIKSAASAAAGDKAEASSPLSLSPSHPFSAPEINCNTRNKN